MNISLILEDYRTNAWKVSLQYLLQDELPWIVDKDFYPTIIRSSHANMDELVRP